MAKRVAAITALTLLAGFPSTSIAVDADSSARKSRIGKSVRLKSFGSCAALVRYGRRHVRLGVGAPPPIAFPEPLIGPQPRGMPGPPAPGTVVAPGAEDLSGDSGTNVQEPGVDEPDLVKAARGMIFVITANRLHAVRADGLEEVGSLELEGWGHQMLLDGNRLLVISQTAPYGAVPTPYGDRPVASGDFVPGFADAVTQLKEIDVGDPAAMKVRATERIRGEHLSSRLSGDTARVVLWSRPRAVIEPGLRAQVRGWLPRRVLRRAAGGRPRFRPAARCQRVMRPAVHSGVDLLTVLTIDMGKGLPAVDSDAVLGGGQTVYASKRALYVGLEKWSADSPDPADPGAGENTQLHKFDTSDPDSTSYRASGRVAGHLLSQFSMSEHEGVLRVARTRSRTEGPDPASESGVVTVAERDGALVQLGQVGGLGKGERIRGVRFLGEVGYVVTFRQIDPLYTIDLSRPGAPRVAGELKIPGYSAYLHPVGKDLLLGVGQDATTDGRLLGTQVSLFDVSDPAKPARLHQRTLGSASSSAAEWDHHAFLWWAPAKLAVVPLEHWGDGNDAFVGALGVAVDPAGGIAEVGRTSHRYDQWPASVRRSLIVGGRLVTISDAGIQQNSLSNLATEDWLAFPAPG
jgi:hypothetical protein